MPFSLSPQNQPYGFALSGGIRQLRVFAVEFVAAAAVLQGLQCLYENRLHRGNDFVHRKFVAERLARQFSVFLHSYRSKPRKAVPARVKPVFRMLFQALPQSSLNGAPYIDYRPMVVQNVYSALVGKICLCRAPSFTAAASELRRFAPKL